MGSVFFDFFSKISHDLKELTFVFNMCCHSLMKLFLNFEIYFQNGMFIFNFRDIFSKTALLFSILEIYFQKRTRYFQFSKYLFKNRSLISNPQNTFAIPLPTYKKSTVPAPIKRNGYRTDLLIKLYVLNSKIFLLSTANDRELSFYHIFLIDYMLKVCYTFTIDVNRSIPYIFTGLSFRR